jgi:selenide, water dikinase
MIEAGADAATDITGFGLLGHLHELLVASELAAELDADAVPLLEGVVRLAEEGVIAGGTRRNRSFVEPFVEWGGLSDPARFVLADAQTSGGLLIATRDGDRLRAALERRGVGNADIGTTVEGPPGRISIRGRLR